MLLCDIRAKNNKLLKDLLDSQRMLCNMCKYFTARCSAIVLASFPGHSQVCLVPQRKHSREIKFQNGQETIASHQANNFRVKFYIIYLHS